MVRFTMHSALIVTELDRQRAPVDHFQREFLTTTPEVM